LVSVRRIEKIKAELRNNRLRNTFFIIPIPETLNPVAFLNAHLRPKNIRIIMIPEVIPLLNTRSVRHSAKSNNTAT
jgi:hypothetical protein